MAETDYVEEILTAAGFGGIAIETLTTHLTGAATAEEEAEFACVVGPLTRLIRAREPDPATIQAIVLEVTERFRPYQSEDGVRIPATLHYVTRKPTMNHGGPRRQSTNRPRRTAVRPGPSRREGMISTQSS